MGTLSVRWLCLLLCLAVPVSLTACGDDDGDDDDDQDGGGDDDDDAVAGARSCGALGVAVAVASPRQVTRRVNSPCFSSRSVFLIFSKV